VLIITEVDGAITYRRTGGAWLEDALGPTPNGRGLDSATTSDP
jgi:hypothetical protein